jgi:hypothetical protein
VVAARSRGRIHRLGLEQAADDDPAAILPRLAIRPAQLVSDAFPISAEPDVVDPAKTVKIVGNYRSGHPVSRFKQQRASVCALLDTTPTYLQSVSQP